jgi:hypothetical protein
MPLTPEQQKELRQLELEQLEEEEADYQAQQAAPQRAPRIQQPDTPVSSPEATGRGLADVLTFGTAKYTAPAIRGGLEAVLPKGASEYLNLKPYEVEKAKYEEREDVAKQYEPASYLGGQALGLGSQLLAAPFAGAAAGTRAAAQSAFQTPVGQAGVGAVQAGAESGFDPLEVLKGAGTASALTKLGGMGATALQPKLESAAYERAAKATGADILKPSRRIERLPGGRQAYGKQMLEQGIVTAGKNVPQIAEKAVQQEAKQGKIIGDIYAKIDKIADGKVPEGTMENILAKIYKDVIQPLRKTASTADMADRVESAYVSRLANMIEEGYQPSFKGLHDELRGIGEKAYTPTGTDKPLNEQMQKISKIVRGQLQKSAGELEGGESLVKKLKAANQKYSFATEAAQTAQEKATRMATNRGISLTDYITGAGLAGAGGATMGVGGAIGGASFALVNKIARERGPQVAASMLNAAQKMAKNDPELVGVYLNFLAGEQATKRLPGGKE